SEAYQYSGSPVYSDPPPFKFSTSSDLASGTSTGTSISRPTSGESAQGGNWNPAMGPTTALPAQSLPERDPSAAPVEDVPVQVEDEGAMASIFSATSVFVVIVLGLFGLLVTRKLRSR